MLSINPNGRGESRQDVNKYKLDIDKNTNKIMIITSIGKPLRAVYQSVSCCQK